MRICGLAAVGVMAAALAGSAGAEKAAQPNLGDSFAMVFTVKSQKNFGVRPGFRFGGLIWAFVPRCDVGACAVELSTAEGACVSGSCPQLPTGLIWSHEVLRPASGVYKGAFTVKSNCASSSGNLPYAYNGTTGSVGRDWVDTWRGGPALLFDEPGAQVDGAKAERE
jgi:hypothetical protein